MGKKYVKYDNEARIKKIKERHGEDAHKKWGAKGGKLNPKKYDSKSGSAAANKRWQKYREEKAKNEEGSES